jgi:LysM repeat protein
LESIARKTGSDQTAVLRENNGFNGITRGDNYIDLMVPEGRKFPIIKGGKYDAYDTRNNVAVTMPDLYSEFNKKNTTPAVKDVITIQSGDNLSTIAKKYGTTVDNIMRLNPHIKDANKIYVGQQLQLAGDKPMLNAKPYSAPSQPKAQPKAQPAVVSESEVQTPKKSFEPIPVVNSQFNVKVVSQLPQLKISR